MSYRLPADVSITGLTIYTCDGEFDPWLAVAQETSRTVKALAFGDHDNGA